MVSRKPILLHVSTADLADVEGRLFQAHVVHDGLLKLTPCSVTEPDTRCPIIVAGERCGCAAGHAGKHRWAGGD